MDVLVIGGGVIGYSVAHTLAARGVDVRVIEMRGPGSGATQASAGMLTPYIEGHDATLRRLGLLSLERYDDFVHHLDQTISEPVEYSRAGSLQVSLSAAHAAGLERDHEQLVAEGVPHSLLNGGQVRELEPALADTVRLGLFVPAHGFVHVAQLMAALRYVSERHGVRTIIERVIGIERSSRGVSVVTDRQKLDASVVVVAAGSWSGQLAVSQSPPIPVRPIKGQLVEMRFDSPPLSRVVWSEDCYLVPWRSGSVIVGATVEDVGFDESPTPEAIDALLAGGRAVLPSIASAHMRAVRVGLRPATRDELPLVGWSSTMRGVCLASGHYRNGILLAPLTAALVAETVLGSESPELLWPRAALAPSRMGL